MNLEDTIPRRILWIQKKSRFGAVENSVVNFDAAKIRPLPPRPHLSITSNILFLFVRFHVCVCCWFFTITNLWDENSYVCNIPQTFASARATMKSSCPDSSHWKRLVPASCLLSHPCPSPTRRCSTPSLSNLWHLCHSCHLFLQHHKKLFKILTRHVKSSNTFTNFKMSVIWRNFPTNLISRIKFHPIFKSLTAEGSQFQKSGKLTSWGWQFMPVFIRCLYIPGGCLDCLGCLNHQQYDYDYDSMIHVEEALSSLFWAFFGSRLLLWQVQTTHAWDQGQMRTFTSIINMQIIPTGSMHSIFTYIYPKN